MGVTGTIMKNTASLILGRLISRIFLFFLMVYAARTLGVERYGVFSYALALVTLLAVTMDLGISRYMVQHLSRDPARIQTFLGGSLSVKAVLTLFGIALIMGIVLIMRRDSETLFVVFLLAIYIALDSLSMVFTSIFQASQRMGYQAILVSISNIAIALAGLVCLYFMPSVLLLCTVYVLGGFLRLVLVAIWCVRLYGTPNWEIDFPFYRSLIRNGIPFSLVTAFVTIYYYIDTIILSVYSGNDAVGFYNAAYRFLEAPLFLVAGLTTAIFPAVSKLFVEDKARLRSIVSSGFQKALVFGSLIALTIAFLSDDLVAVFYGSDYRQSSPVLSILVLSVGIIMPSTILGTTARAIGKQIVSAWVTGIGAALNIVLNLIFIPRYSVIGAAWTTVFTEVFVIAVYAILIWQYIGPFLTIGYLVRWLGICVCTLLFLHFTTSLGLFLQLALFAIMMIPLLIVFDIYKIRDFKGLINILPIRRNGVG